MRRSLGRRGNNMSGNHGPLMTEHLQDIDLELELLKRKREMIEQQQQLLVMEQQYKSSRQSYDQMRYDEPDQHGSNRDYNHMYDSGLKRNQFGRKRQPESQWQYDGPPKKVNPKKKPQFNPNSNSGPANVRNQRSNFPKQGSKHPYGQPAPLMDIKIKQSIGQKIANQKLTQQKKNFAPTKVTKSKAPPAPNKLASHSVAQRKSLVAAATGAPSGDVTNMLLPDRVPTQQVSGRLELALGAIMKNVRGMIDRKPEHAVLLRTLQMQRVMKQAVRERIRNVMLGKVVGSLIDILAIYREEFPEETDLDILNLAIETGGTLGEVTEEKPKSKFIETDDPGEFFKINMTALIESKLNEMFSKLENMVNEETPEGDDNSDQPEGKENGIKSEKPDDSETEKSDVPVKSDTAEKLDTTEKPDTPEKLENSEQSNNPEQSDNLEKSNNTDKSENPEKSDNPDKSDNQVKNENSDNQANLSETAKNEKDEGQEYKEFLNSTVRVHQVRRILPRLLKRFTPYIIKLINVDSLYQSTKAAIVMKTNQKAARITGTKLSDIPEPVMKGESEAKAVEQSNAGQNRTMYNLPYYVKIMGRPSLPKRRTMQGFLSKFNPKSIKKHRTIHNLLFVGFSEKADFDAMVAADGTVMGRSTLSVRNCSKDNQNSNAEQNGDNNDSINDTDVIMTEVKKEDKSLDEIIPSDLDNQISNLLSTIRKAEEDNEMNTSSNDVEKGDKHGEIATTETTTTKEVDNGIPDNVENDANKMALEEQAADEVQGENNDDQAGQATDDGPKQDTESNKEPAETVVAQSVDPAVGNGENSEDAQTANSESNENAKKMEVEDDKLGELKAGTTGRSTPTRTSARLANVTPSTIRTRRASRLAQN
ncbi:hypothetical protein HW555_011591 [Spodoptera exigua]|uniref:Uncharacterized protein n=1 Tax=Spodoptera exigua TaxID=7107 RepID=A0A835G510_SPOEX|nr:hypothetical protein HW555_011591 [Spodoptera exigua]